MNLDPSIGVALAARHGASLSPFAASFLRRVYSTSLDVYADRLRQYGFAGYGRVLDAGCGFGQWALSLARLNEHVDACDIDVDRTVFVGELARAYGLSNLDVAREDLTQLSYPDGSFDAVFCYGALFLTPWRRSVAELVRVLRPGGRLYVNANGLGWYRHLWLTRHNSGTGYDPRQRAIDTVLNTLRYDAGEAPEHGLDVVVEPVELHATLERLGVCGILQGDEGCLGALDRERARASAFFQGRYGEDLGVYEILAHKRSEG